ncbi:hypothetical protein TNCT_436091 [Trichonephila clavata]|uniref:Uncharacterized protein n=1 Tax=Trichonephila clavata TaxID=2740835 RepID=A0A8X6JB02_TRICU|nr:hypothetical protein TNCT_436091 [Trichonephila clavata]
MHPGGAADCSAEEQKLRKILEGEMRKKDEFSDAQKRYMVNENQALIKSCLLSYSNYVTCFSNSPDIHFSPSSSTRQKPCVGRGTFGDSIHSTDKRRQVTHLDTFPYEDYKSADVLIR